jgi:hypothetical protein
MAQADGCCLPPIKIDCGINAHLNGYIGNCQFGAQAGPWYSYYPYNAYFQTPAPVGGWPYWPASAAPPALPELPSMPSVPESARPAGYAAPAPSYWYGR